MVASKIVYYDKNGNKKIFIGNPKNFKLPKDSLKERPPSVLKPGRERGVPTKFTPKLKTGELKPPPPEYFKRKGQKQKRLDELDPPKPIKGGGFPKIGKPTPFKNKLALKGGGRAYGRNS